MSFKNVNYSKKTVRRDYSKIRTEVDLPGLVEIQTESFKEFTDVFLKDILKNISPITSFNGNLKLYFGDYYFGEPKYSILEAKLSKNNFSRPLRVSVKLEKMDTGEVLEDEIFMGDYPYMTPVGTFVVNGAERVIISQIIRSSGAYYASEIDKKTGLTKFTGQIIPTRGAWLEFEEGSKDILYAKLDRSKKIPATTVLRAFGMSSDSQIKKYFGNTVKINATLEKDSTNNSAEAAVDVYSKLRQGETVPTEGAREFLSTRLFEDRRYDLQEVGRYKYNKKLDLFQRAKGHFLIKDVVDPETGEIIAKAGSQIINDENGNGVLATLKAHRNLFKETIKLDAGLDANPICEILDVEVRNGDSKHKVKIIGNNPEETSLHITLSDIMASFSYYFNLYEGVGTLDDIDHLGNRRIRKIGELIKRQFEIGFAKLEKNIKERMSTVQSSEASPKSLINNKPLQATLKDFFGSSQLSQFMDQVNPLAEITQKRRISALGTGGIARDRASVEVRDVHDTHYGRMCPIETPEGPSIGLITSLASYAKVNHLGFIETPYIKFERDDKGEKYIPLSSYSQDKLVYLTADAEEDFVIASASTKLDENGYIVDDKIIARAHGVTEIVNKNTVDYIDVSPKQVISIAASCIPFLEHNDATRTLMGANMQRQAVPIVDPDSPIVGTGVEHNIAHDAGSACLAIENGIVTYVDAKTIKIKNTETGSETVYNLYKFLRSNQDSCVMQKPIVEVGEYVEAGDIIADGQAMKDGELALGRNVRIAFMTWHGYNYEDAVIMSEKMVKDDVYTSVHIDEHEIECRDTKLGKEEFTREIPNVSAEMTKYLDERGVIIQGVEVKEGDILVGKVTPKGQSEPSSEEKLMLAIFGDKVRDVRDTSLKVRHGEGGIVQSIKYFSKANGDALSPGVNEIIRIYIVKKRKISVGDKMAGRYGNKGVISNILPEEDMPFTSDGRPIDIMLNPQGVPSRMNIGQVLEIHLGIAAQKLGVKVSTPVFDSASLDEIHEIMREARIKEDAAKFTFDKMNDLHLLPSKDEFNATVLANAQIIADNAGFLKGHFEYKNPTDAKPVKKLLLSFDELDPILVKLSDDDAHDRIIDGKEVLYDGQTGEPFENRISVGVMYMIKLSHMVEDKLHARSVGPYTLVTQQPMGGKAQNGGQRFGEMEVWALEAYGAAHTLQEMLTVKSDDIIGRNKVFRAIVDGKPIPESSIPESFRVLTRELQALGIYVELMTNDGVDEANKSLVDLVDNSYMKNFRD